MAQRYSFKEREKAGKVFTATRDGINVVLWALKEHGPFEDDMHATTKMFEWIEERIPFPASGRAASKKSARKSSFSSRLKELQEEGVIDRGVVGRQTRKVQLLKSIDPPDDNPFPNEVLAEQRKPIVNREREAPPVTRVETVPAQPQADPEAAHLSSFSLMPLDQKRAHLSGSHGQEKHELYGLIGRDLDSIHRNAHDIDKITSKAAGTALPQESPSPAPPQVRDEAPPILPGSEPEPSTAEGRLLRIMELASGLLIETSATNAAGGVHVEPLEVEELREKLAAAEARAERYKRQYGQVKSERDSLWHINKRQEANLQALVSGKPIDDADYRDIRRTMQTAPGQDRSNGQQKETPKRTGGVKHTSKSEGYSS